MFIEVVPNRKSPPAVLLRESYREDGKVKKRTLANLSKMTPHVVEGLRVLLKGGVAFAGPHEALRIERSLPHGHVCAVLGTLRDVGLERMLAGGGKLDAAGKRLKDLALVRIPTQSGHCFQSKAATESNLKRPPIPTQSGQS